ncbi:hypothetical protein [Halorubrum ezzemoulense]|nr:hypothetical protein [Halorubrum ezzemoulense]
METRHAVLALVALVTVVMTVRAVVAGLDGDFGTVGRQVGVGGIVLAFGVALYRNWESVGWPGRPLRDGPAERPARATGASQSARPRPAPSRTGVRQDSLAGSSPEESWSRRGSPASRSASRRRSRSKGDEHAPHSAQETPEHDAGAPQRGHESPFAGSNSYSQRGQITRSPPRRPRRRRRRRTP